VKLVALAVAAVSCSRAHDDHPAASPPPPPPAVAKAACTLAPHALRRPQPKRLVAIGDLHGALRAAGAIDDHDAWIGGDLVVVQTGDILDRGDDERAMLDLVTKLEAEAHAAGGELIALVGNHELMNAAGDFRYVTPHGREDFDGERAKELGPGGVYAKRFAQHDVVAIVGDTVFSHAGVLGDWVHHVDDANQSSRCWLDGQTGDATGPPAVLTAQDSPVWTRAAGGDSVDCAQLQASLAALGVKRMVVGHTVQLHVNSLCDGALWRIDVGLAKEYGGPIEVLQIAPSVDVLHGTR